MPAVRLKQLAADAAASANYLRFNGTLWVPAALAIVDDTTPQLGGTLDCNSNHVDNAVTVTFTEFGNGNSGATPTVDWGNGQKQIITLSANATFTFTAPLGGGSFLLRVVQDATGSRTATWPGTVKWAGGTAPTLSTAASAEDIVTFYWNGTNYYGVASLAFA